MKRKLWYLTLFGTLLCSHAVRADEKLAGIACRSVHLAYPAPEGTAFYNEVTVEKSAPGTYFCTNGFNAGYFGIQELADKKKLVIFSVWDPGDQNDPNAVKTEQRVTMLYKDEQVRVGRFGGEGTGGQSFFDYDWKIGATCRFLVTAQPDGSDRTAYTAHFYLPDKKQWKRLVTFSTLNKGKLLGGYYSFVEDFRRNKVSATQNRRARFGNGWIQDKAGQWVALTRARFTADKNPVVNINAGVARGDFYLTTGGDIKNTDIPLWEHFNRPPSGLDLPPLTEPSAK